MWKCVKAVRNLPAERSGSTSIVFALASVAVVAAVGMSVDFGRSLMVRDDMQAALDAAVLAGTTDTTANLETLGDSVFVTAFKAAGSLTSDSQFTRKDDGGVTGVATAQVPLFFGSVLGQSTTTVRVTSETTKGGAGSKVCILLTGNVSQALLVNGGASLVGPDCDVHVQSTASTAAMINSGTALDVNDLCVASTSVTVNGGVPDPINAKNKKILRKGCTTAADPFAGKLPTPASATCTYNGNNYNSGPVTLNPGVYCGWFNFNSPMNVTLNPGVYVIKNGGFNINGGTWTGNGVTFYFAGSAVIQFNSNVTTKFTPPTTGDTAGILFFEAPGLSTGSWILNSGANHEMSGLFYLPSKNVTFNGGANTTAHPATMVFRTLTINSVNLKISPSSTHTIAGSAGASGGGGSSLFVSR